MTREKHGRVDVVVPNAAVVQEQHADFMTAVNFMGVVTAVRLGLEYMSKASGGSGGDVVVMNSISSFLPVSYYPVYCGAKAGVLHYIRSLVSSKSHSGTGVRVISVPESSTRSSSISSPVKSRARSRSGKRSSVGSRDRRLPTSLKRCGSCWKTSAICRAVRCSSATLATRSSRLSTRSRKTTTG